MRAVKTVQVCTFHVLFDVFKKFLTVGLGSPCTMQVRWASFPSPEWTFSASTSISGSSAKEGGKKRKASLIKMMGGGGEGRRVSSSSWKLFFHFFLLLLPLKGSLSIKEPPLLLLLLPPNFPQHSEREGEGGAGKKSIIISSRPLQRADKVEDASNIA